MTIVSFVNLESSKVSGFWENALYSSLLFFSIEFLGLESESVSKSKILGVLKIMFISAFCLLGLFYYNSPATTSVIEAESKNNIKSDMMKSMLILEI